MLLSFGDHLSKFSFAPRGVLLAALAALACCSGLAAQVSGGDSAYLEAQRHSQRAVQAARVRDHGAVVQHLEAILDLTAEASDQKHRAIRNWALRVLLQQSIRNEDPERVQRYLPEYRQQEGVVAAGLLEAEWLLRIGMLRDAAELLMVVRRGPMSPEQQWEWRILQVEELLASEQFDRAVAAADEILEAAAGAKGVDLVRVKLSRAFAWARSGKVAEARTSLASLREDPKAMTGYGGRICAELALLQLAAGDEHGAAEVLAGLAPVPLNLADTWWLLAKTRLALLRQMREASLLPELIELREEIRFRHHRMLRNWMATPEVSSGVAFLQWSARREQLVCLCLLEHAIEGEAAVTRCFDYLLAADACGSLARSRNLAAGNSIELQRRALRHGGALAWFLPAPHGSLALIATGNAVEMIVLPPDQQLRHWVASLRNALVDHRRLGPDWREQMHALRKPMADWLLQPRMRQLLQQHRRWVILGRELLTGMQLEYLPTIDGSEGWLGHTHALEYVPTASLALSSPEAAESTGSPRVALLAAEALQSEVRNRYPQPDLPIVTSDLRKLADTLDLSTVQIACGLGIAGLQAARRNADYLVVFAHGQRRHRDDGWDEDSLRHRPLGMLLSDGFFGAEQLDADADADAPWLVALASCGTARAGVDRGEDGQMFGTAWLAAGTRCVLAAEADLELVATQHLLRAMLGQLALGCEPAEALRRARALVASIPGFEHPTLHCALRLDSTLPGNLRPPTGSRDSGLTWMWSAMGVALPGVIGLWLLGRCRKQRCQL